jgi:hypothetical protein
MESKLPANEKPLIRDPDLAAALEKELEPLSGKQLAAAQSAIRTSYASGFLGDFGQILNHYRSGIDSATVAAAIEEELEQFSGKQLAAARAAVRKVQESGLKGPRATILEAYRLAIKDATSKARVD